MEDQTPEPGQEEPSYNINQRYAVVHWSIAVDKAAAFAKKYLAGDIIAAGPIKVINFFGGNVGLKEEVHQVFLWPYNDLTKPFDKDGLACEAIIG